MYTFINDLRQDEYDDGVTGLLLGEVKKSGDSTYIFVKGAVEVTNAGVFTDKIAFTDETWPIAKSVVAQYFGGLSIVGWYLNSTAITSDKMDVINATDKESFGEEDQVFYMVNPATKSQEFYNKGQDGLEKSSGYAVYFDKNEAMQNYMTSIRKTHMQYREDSDEATGKYRKLINENSAASKNAKRNFAFIYSLSLLLIIVVLVIGINKINSYDKMKTNTKPTEQVASKDDETKPTTPVETVTGDVTTSSDENTTTEEVTTEESTEEETTTEEVTEKPTEAATTEETYDTYTVQAGDSWVSICKKFYNSESMADVAVIMNYNGLTPSDDLLIGAVIKVPRK